MPIRSLRAGLRAWRSSRIEMSGATRTHRSVNPGRSVTAWSADPNPLTCGVAHALANPVGDQRSLHLSNGRKDREYEPSRGRRGVELRLRERGEPDAGMLEVTERPRAHGASIGTRGPASRPGRGRPAGVRHRSATPTTGSDARGPRPRRYPRIRLPPSPGWRHRCGGPRAAPRGPDPCHGCSLAHTRATRRGRPMALSMALFPVQRGHGQIGDRSHVLEARARRRGATLERRYGPQLTTRTRGVPAPVAPQWERAPRRPGYRSEAPHAPSPGNLLDGVSRPGCLACGRRGQPRSSDRRWPLKPRLLGHPPMGGGCPSLGEVGPEPSQEVAAVSAGPPTGSGPTGALGLLQVGARAGWTALSRARGGRRHRARRQDRRGQASRASRTTAIVNRLMGSGRSGGRAPRRSVPRATAAGPGSRARVGVDSGGGWPAITSGLLSCGPPGVTIGAGLPSSGCRLRGQAQHVGATRTVGPDGAFARIQHPVGVDEDARNRRRNPAWAGPTIVALS